MTELNIPDEAHERGEQAVIKYGLVAQTDAYDIASDVLREGVPLVVAEARRQWEAEQLERMRAEMYDIANARHIHVQRSVDRFVDRNNGNVSEQEITDRYQLGVDQWNEMHPALLALWKRYNALVEARKVAQR